MRKVIASVCIRPVPRSPSLPGVGLSSDACWNVLPGKPANSEFAAIGLYLTHTDDVVAVVIASDGADRQVDAGHSVASVAGLPVHDWPMLAPPAHTASAPAPYGSAGLAVSGAKPSAVWSAASRPASS